ncbi:hypothetical protein HDU77_007271 [Chytriomyces hyalinus]|nr:hypothetical protein HDU77_007271 [Chytriomyces hyalinus]
MKAIEHQELITPALLIRAEAMARNRQRMTQALSQFPSVSLRPHMKAHKCGPLALLQVADGALGVCAATVDEVYVAASAGVKDILLSNELATLAAVKRFVKIAAEFSQAKLRICVDSVGLIRLLKEAGAAAVNVGVLIEVDVGHHRCGCHPDQVVTLAQAISEAGLSFDGIQCYQGKLQHIRDRDARRDAVMASAVAVAKLSKQKLLDAGIECNIVTGGGTGTFTVEAGSGVFTEVQPGSYLFMDVDYGKNPDTPFESSLFVLATIISIDSTRSWAVIDAGHKAVTMDSGPPAVVGHAETVQYTSGGDEHGILSTGNVGDLPVEFEVGKQLWLVPGHCDPTVNLYSTVHVMTEDGKSEVWKVGGHYHEYSV